MRSPGGAHGTRHVLLLVSLAFMLAGCVDPDPEDREGRESGDSGGTGLVVGDGAQDEAGFVVPVWQVGDFWSYRDTDGDTNTFVVTADSGNDYTMDTDSDGFAFFDALGDVSTLGPQRKSDLAGSQGSDRVEFFRFPPVDGESWTTTWDGAERTITTSVSDALVSYEATNDDGTLHAAYTFDVDAGWFGSLTFYLPDGSVMFGNELVDRGSGFTGELIRYDLEEVFARSDADATTEGGPDATTHEFSQAEDQDVYLLYSVSCAVGHHFFTVIPEAPTAETSGHNDNDPCPKELSFQGSLGSLPGSWGITLGRATDPDASWSANVYLRTPTVLSMTDGSLS